MFTKMLSLYLYLGVCSAALISGNPVDKNLKFELIQVLFRHGARTPVECEARFAPNSDESMYDPWGYDQLTNEGMLQEYRLGEMLRSRYKDFLPDLYRPEDVFAYSSSYARTKASLQLTLASLYPPTDDLKWKNGTNWLPIPIHSYPRDLDILMKSRFCPNFIETLKELYNTTEIRSALIEYRGLINKFKSIYGEGFMFGKIFCAHNLIVVHNNLNMSLPEWYSTEFFATLGRVSKLYLDTLSYTPVLNRLNGGPLVRKFYENLQRHEEKSDRKKIYLYSGHDKNVYAFLKAHGLTLQKFPDYGSAVILEKLRDEQQKTNVRLLLWTGEPKKLISLKLNNCTETCPIDEYRKIVQPILPTDDEMRCLYKNLQPKDLERIINKDSAGYD